MRDLEADGRYTEVERREFNRLGQGIPRKIQSLMDRQRLYFWSETASGLGYGGDDLLRVVASLERIARNTNHRGFRSPHPGEPPPGWELGTRAQVPPAQSENPSGADDGETIRKRLADGQRYLEESLYRARFFGAIDPEGLVPEAAEARSEVLRLLGDMAVSAENYREWTRENRRGGDQVHKVLAATLEAYEAAEAYMPVMREILASDYGQALGLDGPELAAFVDRVMGVLENTQLFGHRAIDR